ncbi:MAG: ATP-grasp domain-containing protein [Ferrovibrionaceae bacterium]
MRLIEADGKALLAEAGIAVPAGRLYHPGEEIAAAGGRVAIKAQMLAGGRGKQGLVRVVDGAAATAAAGEIRALAGPVVPLLVEAAVDIAAEFYMAWRIDDVAQAPILMFSPAGGIAVEERPDALREYRADPRRPVRPHDLVGFFRAAGAAGRNLGALARFAAELGRVFRAIDAELIEINPLALTSAGGLVALDAKVVVDDNAAFRHRSRRVLVSHALEQAGMTALERRAAEAGCTFVELEGNVALLTGGAGLGMAILDLVGDAGLRAANFVDAPGGSGPEVFALQSRLVFERAARDDVRAILLYLTLSASSLKSLVTGLLRLLDASPPPKPLVVGFAATGSAEREMTMAEAQGLFGQRGYACADNLADAIAALRRVAG